jgi:hypothetical protein
MRTSKSTYNPLMRVQQLEPIQGLHPYIKQEEKFHYFGYCIIQTNRISDFTFPFEMENKNYS